MTPFNQRVKQLLRLNDQQVSQVIEWLALKGDEGTGRDFRRSERLALSIRRALLQLDRIDSAFIVAPLDLSATGAGFLHGAFIYPGTRCIVSLKPRNGAVLTAIGKVVRCRLVRAHVHLVGVEFDQKQDISAFNDSVREPRQRAA